MTLNGEPCSGVQEEDPSSVSNLPQTSIDAALPVIASQTTPSTSNTDQATQEAVLIQVYHSNLHRTHITHTNGYILSPHALIQHTLVFAPLVVSIPTVICQQHNSLEPSQYVLQIYWHTLVLFRIRALMQHYYATYTQYDVLLYLT